MAHPLFGLDGRLAQRRTIALLVSGMVVAACAPDGVAETSTTPAETVLSAPIETTTSRPSTSVPSTSTSSSTTPDTTTTTSATTTTTTTTSTTTTTTTIPVIVVTTTVPSLTTTTVATPATGSVACPPTGSSLWEIRPPSAISPPATPEGWRTEVVGSSVQQRDITAYVLPAAVLRRRVLVIGGLHGNEPVSPPTVRGYLGATIPTGVEVWLVPAANPDGVAAGTRCNANGVDLNRNFSWGWRSDDGGPAALSEPESRAMADLVERLQPDLVIWVHQPYGYASSIGPTDAAFENAWAAAAGVVARPDVTQHGGGESWTAFVAGRPSMLIEIDSWSDTPELVAAHRAGFEAVLAVLG